MNLILHIFRKDLRHHWIEVFVSLALLIAYSWHVVHEWSSPSLEFSLFSGLWDAIPALVPATWCFLIIRAIQDESLVGDRQFWVTRPYEWTTLLSAKALFGVTFINLPLFVIDLVLLAKAGFSPTHYLLGLLWMQLMLVIIMIVPAAAAGTVTSTVVQVLLSAVGLVFYLIGVAALTSEIPNAEMSEGAVAGVADLIIVIGACIAVVFLQFARRKTWMSRALILGAGAAVILVLVATPYGILIAHAYPALAVGQQPAVTLTFDHTPPAPHKKSGSFGELPGNPIIVLPVDVSGVAEGHVGVLAGLNLTIEAPDGQHWTSSWHSADGHFWPDENRSSLEFSVDRKFFDRVKTLPVKIHMTLAQEDFTETDTLQVKTASGKFAVAGVGICWIAPQGGGPADMIACHSPLKTPFLTGRMNPSDSTCTYDEDELPPQATRHLWQRGSDSQVGIVPVDDDNLMFAGSGDNPRKPLPYLCPGTPFTISTPKEGAHSRTELEIDGIVLSDYQWQPSFD